MSSYQNMSSKKTCVPFVPQSPGYLLTEGTLNGEELLIRIIFRGKMSIIMCQNS